MKKIKNQKIWHTKKITKKYSAIRTKRHNFQLTHILTLQKAYFVMLVKKSKIFKFAFIPKKVTKINNMLNIKFWLKALNYHNFLNFVLNNCLLRKIFLSFLFLFLP